MELYILLLGALFALVLAGFFSAVEMAYVSVNRLYFELHSKQGPLGEKLVSGFLKNPILFVGTTLTGNTLFLVLYTVLGVTFLNPLLLSWLPDDYDNIFLLILIETLVLTVLFLPLADYLPKSLALIHPDRFLEWLAVPLWIIYQAISPLVRVLVAIARFFIRYVLRKKNPEIRPVFGLTDLNHYLQQLNQTSTERDEEIDIDARIFNNAIEFRDVRVRDCLVPRTEISAIDVNDTVEVLRHAFQDSGHSKIVIYRDTIDDVIGYCHALTLFRKPSTVADIVTPIIVVPETMPAQDLLLRFLSERKSLALVVDEFGGTAGIVSVEDMVEQIFGEIQDEFDIDEDWVERQIDETNWLLSARHEIDDLNEKYSWSLPNGDYDTLGGLILAAKEDIPQVGDIISFPPFTFAIISMDGTRIDTVKVNLE